MSTNFYFVKGVHPPSLHKPRCGVITLPPLFVVFCCFFALSCSTFKPVSAKSQAINDFSPVWQEVENGIEWTSAKTQRPRLDFWAVRMDLIDLKENGLQIVTNGEQIREGIIPSLTVRHFAERYDCIAAINGGPFDPVSAREGEERELVGLFISEGKMIQRPDPRYDAILFYEDGGTVIKNQGEINNMPALEIERITTAVGGFYTVLSDGIVPPQRNNQRRPRSAVGLSADGSKLFFLVIDGRRLQSVGAAMSETGEILLRLGAASGLNLDGGGSSALILRQNGKPSPLNIPIHGGIPGRERAVASCLGISRR